MLKPVLRQNFTVNSKVLDDVVQELKIDKSDRIIEIGPGMGALTTRILKKFKETSVAGAAPTTPSLLSYEVDEDLKDDLDGLKSKFKGLFDFRMQSILDAKTKSGFNKCTGNIPYHISEPLLFKFIEWNFDSIVLITGIKFARKVTGEIEGKLGIISKYIFDSAIVKEYDKNIFYPRSKVDSALLVLTRKAKSENPVENLISEVMQNTDKKDLWLNKKLGFIQTQKGQIYHMDLNLLLKEIIDNFH